MTTTSQIFNATENETQQALGTTIADETAPITTPVERPSKAQVPPLAEYARVPNEYIGILLAHAATKRGRGMKGTSAAVMLVVHKVHMCETWSNYVLTEKACKTILDIGDDLYRGGIRILEDSGLLSRVQHGIGRVRETLRLPRDGGFTLVPSGVLELEVDLAALIVLTLLAPAGVDPIKEVARLGYGPRTAVTLRKKAVASGFVTIAKIGAKIYLVRDEVAKDRLCKKHSAKTKKTVAKQHAYSASSADPEGQLCKKPLCKKPLCKKPGAFNYTGGICKYTGSSSLEKTIEISTDALTASPMKASRIENAPRFKPFNISTAWLDKNLVEAIEYSKREHEPARAWIDQSLRTIEVAVKAIFPNVREDELPNYLCEDQRDNLAIALTMVANVALEDEFITDPHTGSEHWLINFARETPQPINADASQFIAAIAFRGHEFHLDLVASKVARLGCDAARSQLAIHALWTMVLAYIVHSAPAKYATAGFTSWVAPGTSAVRNAIQSKLYDGRVGELISVFERRAVS
jgi:hypothetical protein